MRSLPRSSREKKRGSPRRGFPQRIFMRGGRLLPPFLAILFVSRAGAFATFSKQPICHHFWAPTQAPRCSSFLSEKCVRAKATRSQTTSRGRILCASASPKIAMAQRPTTVVYIATSLDGCIARADGGIDWLPDGGEQGIKSWNELMERCDCMLMGRKTFSTVIGFDCPWPYAGLKLTVLSSTLTATDIPARLAEHSIKISSAGPEAALREMAADGGKVCYVDGGSVIQSLLREDRVDELVVTTVPILLGTQGAKLFGELEQDLKFEHAGTEAWESGLVKSTYRRVRAA